MKHRFGIVGLVIASGLAAGLPGCGKSSPAEQALASSQKAMKNLHAGVTPAPTETRRATQQKVVADLRGATDGLSGGAQVSAFTLLADAQAGLAQIDAERGTAAAGQLGAGVRELRAAGRLYASQAALASALANFDASQDMSSLEQQATKIEGELATVLQEKRRLQGVLEGLQNEVNDRLAKARKLREEEARVRGEAANLPASSRAEALERARVISRQADALEREAAETRAAAGQVGPQIAVTDLEIERLTTQKSLLGTAAKEITSRKSAREEQSSSARRAADEAAGQVAKSLAALEALRTETFAPAMDAAAQGYQQAIASARRASSVAGVSETRTTSQIAVSSFQQSLGGLEETRARALEGYEATLEWLANLQPALPESVGVRGALTSVREEADRAVASAREAYEAARSSLQSAGARGELAERVEKLLALLPSAGAAQEPEAAPEPGTEQLDAPEMNEEPADNAGGDTGEEPPAEEAPPSAR